MEDFLLDFDIQARNVSGVNQRNTRGDLKARNISGTEK